MGALEDYYNQITSDNSMRKQAEVLRGMIPYPMGEIAANAYLLNVPKDLAPGNAAPFRNDQSAVTLPQQESVSRDNFYIFPEDEARRASAIEQAQAGMYSPYGMGTVNFAGGRTPVGEVSQVPTSIVGYIEQMGAGFGSKRPEVQGPPIPEYLQEGYSPVKAEATGRKWDVSSPAEPKLIGGPEPEPEPQQKAARSRQIESPKSFGDIFGNMDKYIPNKGDQREVMRLMAEQDKANKMQYAMRYAMQNYPPEAQKHALDMFKAQIDNSYAGMDLRRVEETPQYKRASEEFNDRYRQATDVLANLRGQIEYASKLKDNGERAAYLQTAIPKMLNYIAVAAPDAVGVEEAHRIMSEFSTIFNTPITKWGDLASKAESIFTKDTEGFLEKAKSIYNISSRNLNSKVDKML